MRYFHFSFAAYIKEADVITGSIDVSGVEFPSRADIIANCKEHLASEKKIETSSIMVSIIAWNEMTKSEYEMWTGEKQ